MKEDLCPRTNVKFISRDSDSQISALYRFYALSPHVIAPAASLVSNLQLESTPGTSST